MSRPRPPAGPAAPARWPGGGDPAWTPEPADLEWALGQAHHRSWAVGAALFTAARPPTGLFLLRTGFVQLSVPGPAGDERLLAVVGPPCLAGDPGPVFGQPPAPVTATCITPCEAAFWPYAHFRTMIAERPGLAAVLAYQGMLVYHQALQRVAGLMWPCSRLRVLHTLLVLTRTFSRNEPGPGCRFPPSLTQAGLGHAANASRVTVNRVLADLRRRGIVARSRPLHIRQPDRLEALLKEELGALPLRERRHRGGGR